MQRLSATQGVRKKKSIALPRCICGHFRQQPTTILGPAHESKLQHHEIMCRFQCLLYDPHLARDALACLWPVYERRETIPRRKGFPFTSQLASEAVVVSSFPSAAPPRVA